MTRKIYRVARHSPQDEAWTVSTDSQSAETFRLLGTALHCAVSQARADWQLHRTEAEILLQHEDGHWEREFAFGPGHHALADPDAGRAAPDDARSRGQRDR